MSAAARARLDKGRCKRTSDIMPFIAAGLQRQTPTGLPPPKAKLLPIQRIAGKL
jgi:hypothetical protein